MDTGPSPTLLIYSLFVNLTTDLNRGLVTSHSLLRVIESLYLFHEFTRLKLMNFITPYVILPIEILDSGCIGQQSL